MSRFALISTAEMDNQLAAVSQQEDKELALFRDVLYLPLHVEKAVLSLNGAALSPRQDTNAAVVPVQRRTTITP